MTPTEVRAALQATGWRLHEAAPRLGIGPRALYAAMSDATEYPRPLNASATLLLRLAAERPSIRRWLERNVHPVQNNG